MIVARQIRPFGRQLDSRRRNDADRTTSPSPTPSPTPTPTKSSSERAAFLPGVVVKQNGAKTAPPRRQRQKQRICQQRLQLQDLQRQRTQQQLSNHVSTQLREDESGRRSDDDDDDDEDEEEEDDVDEALERPTIRRLSLEQRRLRQEHRRMLQEQRRTLAKAESRRRWTERHLVCAKATTTMNIAATFCLFVVVVVVLNQKDVSRWRRQEATTSSSSSSSSSSSLDVFSYIRLLNRTRYNNNNSDDDNNKDDRLAKDEVFSQLLVSSRHGAAFTAIPTSGADVADAASSTDEDAASAAAAAAAAAAAKEIVEEILDLKRIARRQRERIEALTSASADQRLLHSTLTCALLGGAGACLPRSATSWLPPFPSRARYALVRRRGGGGFARGMCRAVGGDLLLARETNATTTTTTSTTDEEDWRHLTNLPEFARSVEGFWVRNADDNSDDDDGKDKRTSICLEAKFRGSKLKTKFENCEEKKEFVCKIRAYRRFVRGVEGEEGGGRRGGEGERGKSEGRAGRESD